MGNVQRGNCWDAEDAILDSSNGANPSGRRPFPSARQDFHWLSVGFHHLFDADYLNKEFPGIEDNGGLGHSSSNSNEDSSISGRGSGFSGISSSTCGGIEHHGQDEAVDLADAAVFLMDYDKEGERHVGEEVSHRLLQELVAGCHVNDPFARVLAQRTHMLQFAYQAWVRKYRTREKQQKQQQQQLQPHARSNSNDIPSLSSTATNTQSLPSDVHLAMELLFSVLDVVQEDSDDDESTKNNNDPSCGENRIVTPKMQQQRLELLKEIYSAFQDLPPLCLAPEGGIHPEGKLLMPISRPMVLDKLRDFLYLSCFPPTRIISLNNNNDASLHGKPLALKNEGSGTKSRPSSAEADCLEEDRELATLSLISLSSAAGRAKDLLLLIKMLFRVGYGSSNTSSLPSSSSSDDGHCIINSIGDGGGEAGGVIKSSYTGPTGAGNHSSSSSINSRVRRKLGSGRRVLRGMGTVALQTGNGRYVESSNNNDALCIEAPANDEEDDGIRDEDDVSTDLSVPHFLLCTSKQGHASEDERATAAGLGGSSISSSNSKTLLKEKPRHRSTGSHQSKTGCSPPPSASNCEAASLRRRRTSLPLSKVLPFLRQLAAANIHGANSTAIGVDILLDGQPREVWTCGQNSYGELAHGDTSSRKQFILTEACQGRDIVGVAAGNEHTVLLSRSGEVFSAGYNDNGQAGVGSTQRVGQVTLVEKLVGKGAMQVHAYNGCEHTLILLQDGRLVSFGYNYRGQLGHGTTASEPIPRLVKGLENKRVSSVSCSYYHSIVACDNGEIYTFGRNDFGQLGQNDTIDKKVPQLVHALRGHTGVSLACGQYHTMVATKEGHLFSSGKNDYGQLGMSSEGQKNFVMVESAAMEGAAVTEVRCGYYHSIVLCEGGHVYAFGRNDYGQCGLGHIAQRVHEPQLVEAAEGKGIVRIAAGCYHTVLVGKNGMLYVCGRNNHGQLGTNDTNERHTPHPIDLFLGKRVAMVAAGFYHTIVLTGGIDADAVSSHAGNYDFSAFSPTTFLDLPSFAMPYEAEKDVKPADQEDVIAESELEAAVHSSSSLKIGENENLVLSQALFVNATRGQEKEGEEGAREGVTTAITLSCQPEQHNVDPDAEPSPFSPATSPPRLHHSISSPAVLATPVPTSIVVNAMPTNIPLPTTVAPITTTSPVASAARVFSSKPNAEKSLCNLNGTITSEKIAIFILAQMDRLSSFLCPHAVFPPALASKACNTRNLSIPTALNGGDNKCFGLRTYHVDVSPETFELLLCLLTHFRESDPTTLLEGVDLGDDSINFVYAYCILACLRILRANLLQLLMNDAISQKIHPMLQEMEHTTRGRSMTDSFDDLVSLDETQAPVLTATHPHTAESFKNDMLLGLSQLPTQNQHPEPSSSSSNKTELAGTLGRFRDVICALHNELLLLIQSPPSGIIDINALDAIQHEAGSLLIIGLELFYPSQTQKCQLLSNLLICASSADIELDSPTHHQHHRSSSKTMIKTGKSAAQKVILQPLLERLLDENLVQDLIPLAVVQSTMAGGEALTSPNSMSDPETPMRILSSTLHLLVQKVLELQLSHDSRGDQGLHFLLPEASCQQKKEPHGESPSSLSSSTSPPSSGGRSENLLLKLILKLQKHVMICAAKESGNDDDLPPASPRSSGDGVSSLSGTSRGRRLLEVEATRCMKSDIPSTWDFLLQYAHPAISLSIEALQQLPGFLQERARRPSVTTLQAMDSISSQDLFKVEQSFIGIVLPSLITGLLPFAYQPHLAMKLMPIISDLHRILNCVAAATAELVALDAAYLRQKAGDRSPLDDSGSSSFGGGVGGAAGMSPATAAAHRNRRRTRSLSGQFFIVPTADPLRLPPLYCLVKSVACLASRLAGTLTVGEGKHRAYIQSITRHNEGLYARWLSSDLLDGGVEPSYSEILGGRPSVMTPPRRPKAPAQSNRPYSSSDLLFGLPTSHSLALFLDKLAGTRSSTAVAPEAFDPVTWLRKEYMTNNLSYAILRRQADKSSEVLAAGIDKMERSVCAAMIKHAGLDLQIYLLDRSKSKQAVKKSSATAPSAGASCPKRLLMVWKAVAEVFCWFWRQRNESRSAFKKSPSAGGVSGADARILSMLEKITDAASFLLLYVSNGNAEASSLCYIPGLKYLTPPHMDDKRRNAACWSKFRRAMLLVRSALRWQGLVKSSSTSSLGHEMISFLQNAAVESHSAKKNRVNNGQQQNALAGLNDRPFALSKLIHVMLDNHRRALARDLGFRSFHTLLTATKLPSVRYEVLHALGSALRDPNTVAGHYLTGLSGVGDKLQRQVQRSFESLYEDLCQRMVVMVDQINATAASHGNTMGSGLSSSALSSSSSSCDTQLSILLIEVWGLKYQERDWSFLVNVGIMQVLHKLIQNLTVAARLAPRNAESSSSCSHRSSSLSSSNMTSKLPGSSTRASSAATWQGRRRAKQSINAAWLLMRLIVSRIPGISHTTSSHSGRFSAAVTPSSPSSIVSCRLAWSALLEPIFEIMAEEAYQSILTVQHFTGGALLAAVKDRWEGSRSGSREDQHHHYQPQQQDPFGRATITPTTPSSHQKRCQELISSPRRFMNMENGFVFPADHLLSSPTKTPSDFSLSCWLYLTQDSTGKYRTILTRGHKTERWAIMLRDVDRRIEVGFGLPNMATLCERLTSKDPLPLNKWCHVCLVSEGSKLRLYINGVLDYQRSNIGVPKECKHPLYVGKVPDTAIRLQGVKGGFEGSLSSLRYYTRALSPIHIRILCDQGPPEVVGVKDRKCFQVCSLISLVAKSPVALNVLCSRRWLSLILYMMIHGTSRVQQAAIRILKQLLPHTTPQHFATLTLLDGGAEQRFRDVSSTLPLEDMKRSGLIGNAESSSDGASSISAVQYLLRLIGLGVKRTRLEAASQMFCCEENTPSLPLPLLEQLKTTTIHLAVASSSSDAFARFLPNCLALCCFSPQKVVTIGDEGALSRLMLAATGGKEAGRSCLGLSHSTIATDTGGSMLAATNVVRSEAVQDCWVLASELTTIVQKLASHPAWKQSILHCFDDALQNLSNHYVTAGEAGQATTTVTDAERLKYAESIAALCVLGGHSDMLRTGVAASVKNTDVRAVVVGYDDITCLAHLTVPKASQSTRDNHASMACASRNGLRGTSTRLNNSVDASAFSARRSISKTLRVNADEISVLSDIEGSVLLWKQEGDMVEMKQAATSAILLCKSLLSNLLSPSKTTPDTQSMYSNSHQTTQGFFPTPTTEIKNITPRRMLGGAASRFALMTLGDDAFPGSPLSQNLHGSSSEFSSSSLANEAFPPPAVMPLRAEESQLSVVFAGHVQEEEEEEKEAPAAGTTFTKSAMSTVMEEIFLAQTRSLCVKIIYCMTFSNNVLPEVLRDHPSFVQQLLALAIQPDSSPTFITLEEAEMRAVVMRKRLNQLTACEIQPAKYRRNSGPLPSEGVGREPPLRHLGTSLLNCPACLVRLPGGSRHNHILNKDGLFASPRGGTSGGHMGVGDDEEDPEQAAEEEDEGQRSRSTTTSDDIDQYYPTTGRRATFERLMTEELGDDDDDNDSDDLDDSRREEEEEEQEEEQHHSSTLVSTELQEQLMMMGFPEDWCAMALRENDNDIISASSWIVDNLDMLTSLGDVQQTDAADEEGNEQEEAGNRDDENGHSTQLNVFEWSSANAEEEEQQEERDSAERQDAEAEAFDSSLDIESNANIQDALQSQDRRATIVLRTEEDMTDMGQRHRKVADSLGGNGESLSFSPPLQQQQRYPNDTTPQTVGTFNLLENRDRFAEECAGEAYKESYFPAEVPAMNAASCPTIASAYPASGSPWDASPSSTLRIKAINSEVAGMDLEQLLSSSLQTEATLAILYARATMVKVLTAWPMDNTAEDKGLKLDTDLLGHHHMLLQLIKIVLFRGCQFPHLLGMASDNLPPTNNIASSNNSPWSHYGETTGSAKDPTTSSHARLVGRMSSLLLRLLKTEMASTSARVEKKKLLEASFSSSQIMNDNDPQTLGCLLTYCCVDEFEAAALIGVFSDMHWGHRYLNMPDSLALLQPNVELAFWLMDQLLYLEYPQVYTISVFTRLCNCLRSANLPLKETVFRILTRLFVRWIDLLQQDKQILQLTGIPRSSSSSCSSSSSSSSSSRPSDQGATAAEERVTAIRDAIGRHLSMSRIQSTVLRRVAYERRQDRLMLSSYVCSAVDFIVTKAKLQETLAEMSSVVSQTPASTTPLAINDQEKDDSRAITATTTAADQLAQSTTSTKSVGGFVNAPLVDHRESDDSISMNSHSQLEAPRVHQTSDNSILVQWRDASFTSSSFAGSHLGPSSQVSSFSSIFELEVSDKPFCRREGSGRGDSIINHEKEAVADVGSLETGTPHELLDGDRMVAADGSYRSIYRGPALHYSLEGVTASKTYHFRIRASSSNDLPGRDGMYTAGRWSSTTSIQTKAMAPFTFDRLNCGPSIYISRDNMSASFANNESWSTVLGTTGFVCGKNVWEVHIEKSSTSYIFLGVARKSADLATFLGGDDVGWGYIGDRALYNKRSKVRVYGNRFGEGDTIRVTLDMDRGTLSFAKNGVDMGVAFEGLAGELFPAFAFYNQSQRISLIRSSFFCPGAGVCISGSPASMGISDVSELSSLMGCMLTRQRLPLAILREAYRDFLAWQAGTTYRCTTLAGYQLQLDTSDEACNAFCGLQSGDRVRTPRGNATVMGVTDGKPWFQIDGEEGCWFFSSTAIREGRAKGLFRPMTQAAAVTMTSLSSHGLIEDTSPLRPRRDSGERTQEVKEGDADQGGAITADASSSTIVLHNATTAADLGDGKAKIDAEKEESSFKALSMEEFQAICDCPRWTAVIDSLLVRILNEFCDRKQLSPWNLTYRVILAIVAPIRRELSTLAQEADHHASAGVTLRGSNSSDGEPFSDLAIICRFSLLRVFNNRLVPVLPMISFGDGLPSVALPAPMSSVWGLPPMQSGLEIGDHPRRYIKPSFQYSQGSGKGLGHLLCTLRGSIFMTTKNKLLRLAIQRTMTITKKAEDDYEYPEDLPQIMVNRPKAITARHHSDPEHRLGMSLFGQLFDELHFLDPALLRIGYSHPMDEGQRRTFKIKFEGEGVDDYGGPYREIFGQVSDELQAMAPVSLGTDPHERLLPLLRPTPNATTEVECSDAYQLNLPPSRTRYIDLEIYNFLGQLLGIAVRSQVYVRLKFPSIIWKAIVGEPLLEGDLANVDTGVYAFVRKTRQLLKAAASRVGAINPGRRDAARNGEKELMQAIEGLTWTARLSDDTEVELRPGGGHCPVTVEDAGEYIEELLKCRLHENDRGLAALRDGVASVLPPAILPIFTWHELRTLVCGRKSIDIDLLQANTEYDDDVSTEDDHIKIFWAVLREFDEDEVAEFLRFVWARPSLPQEGFHQKFKIQSAVGDGPTESPDTYLPKAHTCFFSLNLPRYSSKEVMAAKLRYAMRNCVEMDADFRLAENEMTGWDNLFLVTNDGEEA